MTPQDFFEKAIPAAVSSGHPWPEYAACEAADESAWGESGLSRHNNLFGQKMPKDDPDFNYPQVVLDTQEEVNGKMVSLPGVHWPEFPDWAASFRERMRLLNRLRPLIPHYDRALGADNGEAFVRLMSPCAQPPSFVAPEPHCLLTGADRCVTWATRVDRANTVLAIYRRHADLLAQLVTRATAQPSS